MIFFLYEIYFLVSISSKSKSVKKGRDDKKKLEIKSETATEER